MPKAALVVFAGTEGREGIGRVVNALVTAKEFKETGDEVTIVFDGAGTTWIGTLVDPSHRYHDAFEESPRPHRRRLQLLRRPLRGQGTDRKGGDRFARRVRATSQHPAAARRRLPGGDVLMRVGRLRGALIAAMIAARPQPSATPAPRCPSCAERSAPASRSSSSKAQSGGAS